MPTENRSSNTEMASGLLPCPFCGEKPEITKHHREEIYSFMHRCQVLGPISWGFREDQHAHIEKWNARAAPAPQTHPEPIAWMVGTAIWWTKEEAERDAAAMSQPVIGLGPMSVVAPTEQRKGEPVMRLECEKLWGGDGEYAVDFVKPGWLQECRKKGGTFLLYTHANPGEVERCEARLHEVASLCASVEQERDTLRAQLADRDALLDRLRNHLIAKGVLGEFGPELFQILNIDAPERAARAALSASAEPSAPAAQSDKCLDGGDCGIGGTCKWCPHTSASPAQQPS